MSWALPLTVTHTPVSTSASDPYGNPSTVDGPSAAYNGDIQPLSAAETEGVEFRETEDWRLYLDATADGNVDAGDRFTVNGDTYEAVGPPEGRIYGRPLDHVRLRVRRVT